jgi:hypothetical protein
MDKKMEGRMVNLMAVSVRCGEAGNDVTTEMAGEGAWCRWRTCSGVEREADGVTVARWELGSGRAL